MHGVQDNVKTKIHIRSMIELRNKLNRGKILENNKERAEFTKITCDEVGISNKITTKK